MRGQQELLVMPYMQKEANQKRMIPSINCIDLTKASYFNLGQAMQQ